MRELTTLQEVVLSERSTRPVYLVALDAGGDEYYSTNGTQVVGGIEYVGGSINLRRVTDWSEAAIELPATPERVSRLIAGEYRRAPCDIYHLPGTRCPLLIEPEYVEEDYFLQGDVQGEPMLLLPGEIDGGRVTERGMIELSVVHRAEVLRYCPSIRIAPPWANHLPRPGTVLVWEGEHIVLEAA